MVSGASPAQWSAKLLLQQQQQQTGVYDNCLVRPAAAAPAAVADPHVIEVAPHVPPALQVAIAPGPSPPEARDAARVSLRSRRSSSSPSGSGRWRLGSFFKRKGSEKGKRDESEEQHFRQLIVKEANDPAPPLPPRQAHHPTGFQPTLGVKPDAFQMSSSSSLPGQLHSLHSPTVPSLSPFSNYDNGLYFYNPGEQPPLSDLSQESAASRVRTSWKEQKEDMMMRVEAKRNSFRGDSSSEDEREVSNLDDEASSQNSSVAIPFEGEQQVQQQRRSGRHQGRRPASWRRSQREGEDPLQAQMDVLARLSQIDSDFFPVPSPGFTTTPPPPPPRDPRRKLYLVGGGGGRPISYSFERLPAAISPVSSCHQQEDPPSDLGLPIISRQHSLQSPAFRQDHVHHHQHLQQMTFQPIRGHPTPPLLPPPEEKVIEEEDSLMLRSRHLSASEHRLASPSHLIRQQQQQQHRPSSSHVGRFVSPATAAVFEETPRSRRAIRLDRSLPPNVHQQQRQQQQQQQQPVNVLHRLPHHSSQPTLLVDNTAAAASAMQSSSNPPAEYWKPPPPFSAIPLHFYEKARLAFSDHSRDCSPQRPLRKKTAAPGRHHGSSSRDSVISPQQSAGVSSSNTATSSSSIEKSGKSSPSSVSSKDSGCSEPHMTRQQQQHGGGGGGSHNSRPLETLIEKSESADRIIDPASPTPPPPPVKEHSPVRSFADDPGFSTRQRRSKFRDAMSELEDVLVDIQRDHDLLDRAERRDLPTAHQELIAQARECFQSGASEETSRQDGEDSGNEENAFFSDLDAFMNWNTSSSFENIENVAATASSPSSGRCSRHQRRRRTRTPSNRRSALYDKKTDDVVYRICRSNNRPPPETANPIAKVEQSYLLLSPAMSPVPAAATAATSAATRSREFVDSEDDEPDVVTDDVGFRHIRDVNSGNVSDPQPKFGIPKVPATACSEKDYLHARPASARYRSTFNAMRNPDLVLDDLAFRNLRKDDSLADPVTLGNRELERPEDPVVPSALEHQKRAKEEEERRKRQQLSSKEPCVFYPNKHNAVMKTLSEHIAKIIRKQAGIPSASGGGEGGREEKIITYEDLKNPEVYEAVRYALNIVDAEEMERAKREREEVEWNGKNVFQLLSANISELLEKKAERGKKQKKDEEVSESPDSAVSLSKEREEENAASDVEKGGDETREAKEEEEEGGRQVRTTENEIIAQHCILEHDLDSFNERLSRHLRREMTTSDVQDSFRKGDVAKTTTTAALLEMVENWRTQELDRARSDSEARDEDACKRNVEALQEEKKKEKKEEHVEKEAASTSERGAEGETRADVALESKQASVESTSTTSSTPRKGKEKSSSAAAKSSSSPRSPKAVVARGEQRKDDSKGEVCCQSSLLDWLLGQPFLLVGCYALACLHQVSGLDFLTAVGVILAAISMISIYFI